MSDASRVLTTMEVTLRQCFEGVPLDAAVTYPALIALFAARQAPEWMIGVLSLIESDAPEGALADFQEKAALLVEMVPISVEAEARDA